MDMKNSSNEITSKNDIINYFQDGCKKVNQLNIGVEHEKFLFEKKSSQRVNFQTISKVFDYFKKFDWKPIQEANNTVALLRDEQTITLEPGNQIELSGAKYNFIIVFLIRRSIRIFDYKVKNYVKIFLINIE